MIRSLAPSLAVLSLLVCIGGRADYQDGLDAYSTGDYRKAYEEWRAITDGDPGNVVPTIYAEAHYAIAKLYWQGEGVKQDYVEAREWLIRAAELGHAGAQAKLGFMYTDGLTVTQDYEQALQWFSKAARGGNVDGLYNLGIFYLYGWGTEADRTMAKQYLASASALGDPDAEEALQRLLTEERELRKREMEALVLPDPPVIVLEELPEEEPPPVMRDELWILEQDPDHYTIQVMALSSSAKLDSLIEGHEDLAPYARYRLENNGSPLFVLVQGRYEDVESARAMRDEFPSRIQRPSRLWIRRFEMVQQLILAEMANR